VASIPSNRAAAASFCWRATARKIFRSSQFNDQPPVRMIADPNRKSLPIACFSSCDDWRRRGSRRHEPPLRPHSGWQHDRNQGSAQLRRQIVLTGGRTSPGLWIGVQSAPPLPPFQQPNKIADAAARQLGPQAAPGSYRLSAGNCRESESAVKLTAFHFGRLST
jgi:hypothetical protein